MESDPEFVAWLAGVRDRLRAARARCGLSFRAAGDRTGVPFQTITRIEAGRNVPTVDVLFKLARGYGMSLVDVLCGPGPPCPDAKPERPRR